jgi:Ca-activated chloride channel family protein
MNKPSDKKVRAAPFIHVACALLVLAASGTVICQQTAPKPQQPSATQQSPVVFTVTVTDKRGGYVTGLDKSNFAVFDDKAPQEITYFKAADEPVSVGIVFDASGSMADPNRRDLIKTLYREALSSFIRQSNESNIYFVIGLNDRPQLLLDWRRGLDAINDALVTLGSVKLKGNTALYDACYLGIEKLARSAHRKRVLLVISDGQDNESHYRFSELRQRLKESDVLLYAIAINSAIDAYTYMGTRGRGILDEVAAISGGVAFFPDKPPHVRNIFDLIAAELRHQYSIGFIPATSTNKSEWRRIKIKLNLPPDAPREMQHLLVRSRDGYYSAAGMR